MKKLSSRGLVVLGVVATLGLSTPAIASASTGGGATTPLRTSHQTPASYRSLRHAIESTFRSTVNEARAIYQSALAQSTNSAERSAARQAFEFAIIQAASVRSAALRALGSPPNKTP
jgi:hypothetical protein